MLNRYVIMQFEEKLCNKAGPYSYNDIVGSKYNLITGFSAIKTTPTVTDNDYILGNSRLYVSNFNYIYYMIKKNNQIATA